MNMGERIKNLRESRGLSQEGLGKILGVDRTTIVKWETGASRPTRSLKRLAHYFNVTTDYILGNEEPRPKSVFAALPVVGNIIKTLAALSPQKQEQAASYIAFLAQDDKKA